MEKHPLQSPPGNALFRNTPQAICWLDPAGRIVAATQAFDRLFPAATSHLQPFREVAAALFPPGTGMTWEKFWADVQLNGEETVETESAGPGQAASVLEIQGVVRQIEGDAYTCLLCTDVTRTRRLSNEADRQVTRFRRIVQESVVMICGLDQDHRIVIWNGQCERVTGYSREEMTNDPDALRKLYPDVAPVTAILNRLSAADEYTEYEAGPVTHLFGNERRRTISWVYRLNRTPLEEVKIWAIGTDLTEVYEATNALSFNEERFRAISQATNDVLWDWDLQTDQVWWGNGMSGIFGHDTGQTTSHINWWVEHIHEDDRERVFARIKDHINRKEEFWLDEYRFRRGDDSYASVLDKGRLMLDAQGRPFRMVGGIKDITDLRIALEKIQLRDRQLAEVSFYNSHKVRAPLARLMGLVQVLRLDHDTPPEEHLQLLDKIRSSAEELDYLIRNINRILH